MDVRHRVQPFAEPPIERVNTLLYVRLAQRQVPLEPLRRRPAVLEGVEATGREQ
jgi:hypothetical protein